MTEARLGGCGPVIVRAGPHLGGGPDFRTGSDPAGRPPWARFGHRQCPRGSSSLSRFAAHPQAAPPPSAASVTHAPVARLRPLPGRCPLPGFCPAPGPLRLPSAASGAPSPSLPTPSPTDHSSCPAPPPSPVSGRTRPSSPRPPPPTGSCPPSSPVCGLLRRPSCRLTVPSHPSGRPAVPQVTPRCPGQPRPRPPQTSPATLPADSLCHSHSRFKPALKPVCGRPRPPVASSAVPLRTGCRPTGHSMTRLSPACVLRRLRGVLSVLRHGEYSTLSDRVPRRSLR